MPLLTNVNPGPTRAPLKTLPPQVTSAIAKDLQTLGFQVKL